MSSNNKIQIKEYTFQEKKKINDKINKLKKIGEKKDFIVIGKLIKKSLKKNDITEKNNGIWFDLSLVDNITIYKIEKYLKKIFKDHVETTIDSDSIDHSYMPYYIDPASIKTKIGPKFSKKEKNLINRFRNNSTTTLFINTADSENELESENNLNNVSVNN